MPARYGQSVTPATGASATVMRTSSRWRDATTTRLVEPAPPGATRTRPPAASVPTNATRTTTAGRIPTARTSAPLNRRRRTAPDRPPRPALPVHRHRRVAEWRAGSSLGGAGGGGGGGAGAGAGTGGGGVREVREVPELPGGGAGRGATDGAAAVGGFAAWRVGGGGEAVARCRKLAN